MGFEPTRAEHIGLAVQRLNHSATSSGERKVSKFTYLFYFNNNKCLYSNDLRHVVRISFLICRRIMIFLKVFGDFIGECYETN